MKGGAARLNRATGLRWPRRPVPDNPQISAVVSNKMSMSCGNTRKASILLVRKLYTLMQNLGPLPDSVSLNMKLAYYQEGTAAAAALGAPLRRGCVPAVTPRDYQPPGFKEAESDTFFFEKEPVKLTMGAVVTPFHCLKLGMATERHRLEQVRRCHAGGGAHLPALSRSSLVPTSRWRRA